jgi:predicted DNA-binding transcriptional regulator AlpA
MSYVKKIYKPFKIIDGIEYFRVGTVAEIVGKSRQTVQLWDSWSDELESDGKSRLIPKSTRIGKNEVRCWTEMEISQLVEFSKNIKYGDVSKFSRTRWGERGKEIKQDRSREGRKLRQQYRNNVNKVAKKLQTQQQILTIKEARKHMLSNVRKRVKTAYNDINY